jgi:hypothetical protein
VDSKNSEERDNGNPQQGKLGGLKALIFVSEVHDALRDDCSQFSFFLYCPD